MRRYGAVIGAVALVLVVGVGGFASATTNCETFTNHGGQVPAGWTATFYENGQAYGPVAGPGYLAPTTAGEDNGSWDQAIKCRTVTPPDETTTTIIEEPTTTTIEEGDGGSSSTTPDSGTSTTEPGGDSTSTTLNGSETSTSSTSVPGPSPLPDPPVTDVTVPELPYTGAGSVVALILAASSLIGGGVALLRRRG